MRRLLPLLFLLASTSLWAQQMPLSDSAVASVLTCGPGDEFYLRFGHTALRIYDPARGIDNVYNYGTFDFGVPHFYLKFARGDMNYMLSRTTMQRFLATYEYERRAVWESALDLTPRQVCNLYLLLEENYRPEYRYYRYDFFRDNCATRVRDMVEHVAPLTTSTQRTKSYRRFVHQSIDTTQQWWLLGVDLLLGLPADHRCTEREAMFAPLEMGTTIAMQCSKPPRQLLPDQRTPLHRSFPPVVVFALLLALAVALRFGGTQVARVFDRVLFAVAGVVGVVLCLMWFATSHWCTQWNPNILWSLPLWILIAIRMERSPRWSLWLQAAGLLLAAVWVVVCGVSVSVLLIIAALAVALASLMRRTPRRPRRQH